MGEFMSRLWMVSKRVIWALVFIFVIAPIFVAVWFTVALIMAVVDVIGELFGYSIVNSGDLLMQPYEWFVMHVEYIVAGGDAPSPLPYM